MWLYDIRHFFFVYDNFRGRVPNSNLKNKISFEIVTLPYDLVESLKYYNYFGRRHFHKAYESPSKDAVFVLWRPVSVQNLVGLVVYRVTTLVW